MSNELEARRRFLLKLTVAAGTLPLLGPALRTVRAADPPPLPLDNPTAKALAYVEDAAQTKHPSFKPGSNCANCKFYQGPADAPRAPCQLFAGFSVAGPGWCSAWAPK